jgi:hypothetical protein
MHRSTHRLLTIAFALLLAVVASEALAQGARNYGPGNNGSGNNGSGNNGSRMYGSGYNGGHNHSGYRGSYSNYPQVNHSYYGSFTNYNYSYPARGYATYHLPYGYQTVNYRGSSYYYHGGSWYRPYGPRFVVVAPPFGIGVGYLPPYYSTLWYGGSPYYYADSVYYSYRPERREYVVTEPPPEAPAPAPAPAPAGSDEVFVYPREGQSEEQQSTDRYECHRWATERTGFDPTRPAGNVAETDMTSKRADYRRAEAACLDGRGYTVR